jgi:hypothetical protein
MFTCALPSGLTRRMLERFGVSAVRIRAEMENAKIREELDGLDDAGYHERVRL